MSNRSTSLFPSAESVRSEGVIKPNAGTVGLQQEHEEQQENESLHWLTNKSFRSDDAVAIARQHLRTAGDRLQECSKTLPRHRETSESSNSDHDSGRTGIEESNSSLKHLKESERFESSPLVGAKQSRKRKHKRDHEAEPGHRHQRKRHHHDRHHRDKKRKHKKNRRKEHDSSDSSDESPSQRDSMKLERKTASVAEGFFIDVKADRSNLCFNSLHFTDIVAYHRVGQSCLGLDTQRQSVTWKSATKAKKKHKAESNTFRYFTRDLVDLVDDNVEVHVGSTEVSQAQTFQQRTNPTQSTDSYIPIDRPSPPRLDFDPLRIYDPSTQAYLGSTLESGCSNLEKPYQQSAPTIAGHSAFTKTVASYNRHLHEDPHDIPKWLEFVHFQDNADYDRQLSAGCHDDASTAKQGNRKRRAKLIAEKKLAILDKALLRNPNSVPLQLEQLEIGKEFLDGSEQTRQWEKLLKSNPDDIALWREYLLFKQSSFSSFSISKVAGLYGKCFQTLVARQADLDGVEAVDLESHLLDLFVSLCHFWRQAGHTEKAVAAFQAMIELNCFCPPQFQQDVHLQGQVAFLETFWDSAEPRFGERGARGWASWMLKKEMGGWEEVRVPEADEGSQESSTPVAYSSHQPLWQAWMREEVFREGTHFAPWRPDEAKGETEEDCEDPERMVLFDDISQALFKLTARQNHCCLVLYFLDFLGVPVPGCLLQSPSKDTSTSGIYLEQPSQIFPPVSKPNLTFAGVAGNCRTLEQLTSSLDCIKASGVRDANIENRAFEDFVEDVFSQITPVFPQPMQTQLLLMRLDFQMQRAMITIDDKHRQKKRLKEAKRFAKKLLGQEENRNNLDLWAALADWEHSLKNVEEARRVLQTALLFLGQPRTDASTQAAIKLACSFADMFVHYDLASATSVGVVDASNMEALHVLTSVMEDGLFSPLQEVQGQSVSATRILKARRHYQEMITQALDSHSKERGESQDVDPLEFSEWCQPLGSYIVHLTKCFAIFQYLTVGMQAASVIFESTLSVLRRGRSTGSHLSPRQLQVDRELLTVAHVKLFSFYTYSNPSPLGALRNLIKSSLLEFPASPALLEAFIQSETRSHIAGRVRRYFDQATKQSGCPTTWLFATRAELLRQEAIFAATAAAEVKGLLTPQIEVSLPETGISNRIRALFDRASESRSSRHCVLLWRMYMQFEVQQGNLKRAESIFYNALQHCPWAKVLYMDAVRYFPSKLQDYQDLLMEKELRIRAPLEEVELLIKT
ncbi:protein NRDE2 homolog [Acanthaster planci]|uniref:Protein NRDE2 homolog n=1 Tax=Acanthaster planci TaxID=133434 RepID=A0A8B7ZIV5_ACAPL|nr:protein NRDE2 homolog [Acanthaster planci]